MSRRTLYREFRQYYLAERCKWAPLNPSRIFNLAFKTLYRAYRRRLSGPEFLSCVYATLGVREGLPRGLFQAFDPNKYRGALALERHFVNFFKKRLWGRVCNALTPRTDRGRGGDRSRFLARCNLQVYESRLLSGRDRERLESTVEAFAVVVDTGVCEPHRELLNAIPHALTCLNDSERVVVRMKYWGDLSDRKMASVLEVDRKTVASRHEAALKKLRRYYDQVA